MFVWTAAFAEGAVAFAESFAIGLGERKAELVFFAEEVIESEVVGRGGRVFEGGLLGRAGQEGCGGFRHGGHVVIELMNLLSEQIVMRRSSEDPETTEEICCFGRGQPSRSEQKNQISVGLNRSTRIQPSPTHQRTSL